jgi:hypothetical protein
VDERVNGVAVPLADSADEGFHRGAIREVARIAGGQETIASQFIDACVDVFRGAVDEYERGALFGKGTRDDLPDLAVRTHARQENRRSA